MTNIGRRFWGLCDGVVAKGNGGGVIGGNVPTPPSVCVGRGVTGREIVVMLSSSMGAGCVDKRYDAGERSGRRQAGVSHGIDIEVMLERGSLSVERDPRDDTLVVRARDRGLLLSLIKLPLSGSEPL